MTISCDFCGTTFKLADDKIKAGKSKFKCAKCKKIFVVKQDLTEDEQFDKEIAHDGSTIPSDSMKDLADLNEDMPHKHKIEETVKSESEAEEIKTIDSSQETKEEVILNDSPPDESETFEEETDTSEDFMIDLPPEKTEETTQEGPEEELAVFDKANDTIDDVLKTEAVPGKLEASEEKPEQEDTPEDFMIDLPDEETGANEAEETKSLDEAIESGEDEFPSLDDFGDLGDEFEPTEELQEESDITEDTFMDLPDDETSQSEHKAEELLSLDDLGNTDDHIIPSLDNVEDFDDKTEAPEEFQEDSESSLIDKVGEESTQSDAEPTATRPVDDATEMKDDIFPSFDDFEDLDDDLGMAEKSQDEGESIFDSAELPDLDMPGNNEQESNEEEIVTDKSELDDIPSFGEESLDDESAIDEEGFMWDESDSSESESSEELFDVSGEGVDSFDFESEIGDLDTGDAEIDITSPPEDAFGGEQSEHSSTDLELDDQPAPPEISEPDVDLPLEPPEEGRSASSSAAVEIEPAGEVKKSKSGIIIVLLVLFLSLGGAFYYVISSGKNITLFGIDLKETMAKYGLDIGVSGMGKIEVTDLKGYYFQAKKEGMIFVIEGNAVNKYKDPRSFIRVKGNVYDSTGSLVMSKEVYGGNILSRNDLKNFPKEKVLKEMDYRVGKGLINSNIATGVKVPFMVVFYGVSENLTEFDIEVVSSEDATKS